MLIKMLINPQDGYEPPTEFSPNGSYSRISVSESQAESVAKWLMNIRTIRSCSLRQHQDLPTAMNLVGRRSVAEEQ